MDGDADLATIGAAIGDPARALMLSALIGGRSLPATELARIGKVAPSTASSHLSRLGAAGLIEVERRGRHRYHRLADERVAHALEALAAVASPLPIRSLRAAQQSTAERAARSCYDHLAGALGVAVTDQLCFVGTLDRATLGLLDPRPLRALGVDVDALAPSRRALTRACLDWTERRDHLAGRLGAALLETLLERAWIVRAAHGRALTVTPAGRGGFRDSLDLDVSALAA
ncbi:MAG: helix-turn-helix transcriptional regulator [Solirubrobacterales bacterium]|jgi:DNA-binding transcriptional ArsR family regulator|nr:helix-turn-helix transcriptional regulator [Solirubrobacterales bacterium]